MKISINYVKPPKKGRLDFVLDYGWSGVEADTRQVDVQDGRLAMSLPRLDEQGFYLTRIISGVDDYRDRNQLEKQWIPAVQRMIKEHSGASFTTSWALNTRFSDNHKSSRETPVAAPARFVHSDLRDDFNPLQVGREPEAQAAARDIEEYCRHKQIKRWQVFNVWQQISPPPQDTPLALCDLTTVEPCDLVMGYGRGVGQPAEVPSFGLPFYRYNPAHRWFYYSNMLPGEALVFSGLKPSDPRCRGKVPHSAFDDPSSYPKVERSSIEIRVLAVWD